VRVDRDLTSLPDRRRTARRAGGLTALLAGLALLGWWAWQLYGTTWVAQRHHAEIVTAVENAWVAGSAEAEVEGVRARAVVRVPRFGPDFAVPLLAGTSDDVLARGFGTYDGSADPGGLGNLALAGHRVTHGEPLRDMPALRAGDEVVVETRDVVYTYALDTAGDDLSVPFTETWVLDPAPVNPEPGGAAPPPGERRLITLTTCAELFHTDDRWVAFGHLVRKEPVAER
jgi:sortase A